MIERKIYIDHQSYSYNGDPWIVLMENGVEVSRWVSGLDIGYGKPAIDCSNEAIWAFHDGQQVSLVEKKA